MILSIISAIGKNNEIGKGNTLLWDLPADMKHFRETTKGHTVIMGQKTFESIGQPLPNRRNIVLTKDKSFNKEGIETVYSLEELFDLLEKTEGKNSESFIIGGGQIYRLFLNKADKLYITHVNESFPDADTFFPIIDMTMWEEIKSEKYKSDNLNKYDLEFAVYNKKSA
ncbi:MAG TPA: dihydrofolate reductase [Candidatus Paceibacterota bacterium]|nr:dihydrofolate reductase [Candidatus Paceibacterota bacterium]